MKNLNSIKKQGFSFYFMKTVKISWVSHSRMQHRLLVNTVLPLRGKNLSWSHSIPVMWSHTCTESAASQWHNDVFLISFVTHIHQPADWGNLKQLPNHPIMWQWLLSCRFRYWCLMLTEDLDCSTALWLADRMTAWRSEWAYMYTACGWSDLPLVPMQHGRPVMVQSMWGRLVWLPVLYLVQT